MPRIFRAGDFQIDDEVFTIVDDEMMSDSLPEDQGNVKAGKPVVRTADFTEDFGEDEESFFAEQEASPKENGMEADGVSLPSPLDEDDEYTSDGDVIPLAIRKERERIIQQAHAEAEELVGRAQMQMEMDRERMMQEVDRDAAVIKQRAFDEAYQQGLLQGIAQQAGSINDCVSQLQESLTRLAGEQAGFMAEYEHNLKWLALEIASKVLARKIEQDDAVLLELVLAALQNVKSASWVSIEVSDQTLKLMDTLQNKLHMLREGKTELKASAVPPGTVVVETADKLLDASVSRQLENLKRFLQQLD